MRKNGIQIWMAASLCVALAGSLGGCASNGGSESSTASGSQTSTTSAATRTIPASSPLARIKMGMNDTDVRSAVGEPGGTRNYPTFGAFLPWVTNGWRVAWLYPNVGRVVFARNQYSGSMSVVDIQHNPNETR